MMTRNPMNEDDAKTLFVRQLKELSRQGAAPNSEAQLQAIFNRSEAACRAQEEILTPETIKRSTTDTPAS